MTEKKSYEEENKKKYDLEGNTAKLTFKDGRMISRGTLNDIKIEIDLRYCKGCGICTEECPTGALTLEEERDLLRESIEGATPDPSTVIKDFNPESPRTWQELPHHAGLIVASGQDSYNLTGAWRIGEVVIGDANKCVVCGLCYQHCPEDIIAVISENKDNDNKNK
jgi:Pyruvate/2-oxoacid:ferredoxin oxidoreductase delta subunit